VDLDGRFLQAVLDEEVGDLASLVALKLDDLTHLLIFDEGTVTGELLLERLQEFLGIILLRQALEGSKSLSSVSLLNTDVDVFGGPNLVGVLSQRVPFVCEGIESLEVLYAHKR